MGHCLRLQCRILFSRGKPRFFASNSIETMLIQKPRAAQHIASSSSSPPGLFPYSVDHQTPKLRQFDTTRRTIPSDGAPVQANRLGTRQITERLRPPPERSWKLYSLDLFGMGGALNKSVFDGPGTYPFARSPAVPCAPLVIRAASPCVPLCPTCRHIRGPA